MPINLPQRINLVIRLFTKPSLIKVLLGQYHSGYLKEQGWFESYLSKTPIDKYDNPIPWLSYPSIDLLSDRLSKDLKVFEFGSGNSTLFYAQKVNKIICVEHDPVWYKYLQKKLPENAELIFCETHSGELYAASVKASKEKFNLIIVDGIDRVRSIYNSIEALSEDGVLILDDSERIEYLEGVSLLLKGGFKKLDCWGISAGELYKKCTSIFYRNNNCLNI